MLTKNASRLLSKIAGFRFRLPKIKTTVRPSVKVPIKPIKPIKPITVINTTPQPTWKDAALIGGLGFGGLSAMFLDQQLQDERNKKESEERRKKFHNSTEADETSTTESVKPIVETTATVENAN